MHHRISKHIDTWFHFFRDHVKEKAIELQHCHTAEQVADIFTKSLPTDAFRRLGDKLSMTTLLQF